MNTNVTEGLAALDGIPAVDDAEDYIHKALLEKLCPPAGFHPRKGQETDCAPG